MKVKWDNVMPICAAFLVLGAIAVADIVSCDCRPTEPMGLMPGDLVQHKLNGEWRAIVIENQNGPLITLRTDYNAAGITILFDVEWEKE